jgi:acetyl-CoA acetyltransferase
MLQKAFIPYGGYAATAKRWLEHKNWDPKIIDYLVFGITIHQIHGFYGSPYAAALMGCPDIPGVLLGQACTTSTTGIWQAAIGVETGTYENCFCLMVDRTSNGPHTIWPNPQGPGGQVVSEDWVMDNFARDPWACGAMIETAENVAKETGITREQCDALTLRRYQQYQDALADDRAFQKRYMFPIEVAVSKRKTLLVEADEGVTESTAEGLAGLRPVLPDGVHTFGSQTHPADGNCGVTVSTREKAKELSADPDIEIQLISYGYARAKKGYMAAAVYPATQIALDKAGIKADDAKAIKTHNPFAVNDIYLAQKLNVDADEINNYGCSMIYGHPQAPTAGRSIIEGIEAVVMAGGGYLLWGGCAAGDTGAGLVLKIG